MALTKADIWDAADKLAAAGDTPTLAKVRAALGSGSYSTISEAMGEWKARQQRIAGGGEPIPAPVASRIEALGADIWAAAIELAQGRLAAERDALRQKHAELEAGRAEA